MAGSSAADRLSLTISGMLWYFLTLITCLSADKELSTYTGCIAYNGKLNGSPCYVSQEEENGTGVHTHCFKVASFEECICNNNQTNYLHLAVTVYCDILLLFLLKNQEGPGRDHLGQS